MAAYKINLLKKICSYFIDIKIESLRSVINGYLEVILSKGRFQLNTLHATYSYEDLYTSYDTALQDVNPVNKNIHSVLMLGMGLGSIPHLLQKKYGISCEIQCVDIDPEIIRLAEKYYPDPNGFKKLHITCADAFEWVAQNQKRFDLVTVDLFVDREVPRKFHQKDFLLHLKQCVAAKGTILFSRLKSNQPIEYLLWENLTEVFPGGKDIEARGNAIYRWDNS